MSQRSNQSDAEEGEMSGTALELEELRGDVAHRDQEIELLQEENEELRQLLDEANTELSKVNNAQSSGTSSSKAEADTIAELERKLRDALDRKEAAEAEAEGLQHLGGTNDMLRRRHERDTERLISWVTGRGDVVPPPTLGLSGVIVQHAQAPVVAQPPRLELSDVTTLATVPVAAQQPTLSFSAIQAISTVPQAPEHIEPVTNVSHLEFALATALSPPPPPSAPVSPPAQLPPVSPPTQLPTVALTINIQPSDTRRWNLLQRVQRAFSAASSFNINGPGSLVHRFLTEMEQAERDHVEAVALARRWEKVAAEHREEIDNLKEQIRQGRCGIPAHRELLLRLRAMELELAAKESQFQMLLLGQGRSATG
ncbi:hypothetical protein GMOD_00000891 [Pyrenophora seminiperda CCB06]|uniref:Uncharacterized protein n=1 Tax=Pyrenophora seminiperda CCB06 TaxID=1302712 RepID=A0A3M7M8A4_9PLEO|nr:hypothetical protein GMOD_00000891 [Pyrenophora seminiperda CCB06]